MKRISVISYGALGDGKTLDTAAFQAAVNAAEAGDTVFVPSGEYLIGSVFLKSNMRFEMAEGVTLIGSSNMDDYAPVPYDKENRYLTEPEGPYGCFFKAAALCAYQAENLEIVGGRLLFDDLAFDEKRPLNPVILDEDYIQGVGYFRQPSHYYFPQKRPAGVYISRCKGVRVKGLFFEKSPGFSLWALNSENLVFDGIGVKNSKYQWNGDGLHFSSCKNVLVTGCDIDASDDCVAVDGNYGGQSRNICVENCSLKTTMHVIRIYTGLDFGTERIGEDFDRYSVAGVTVRNCEVSEGGGVILLCAFDGDIRDITFEHLICKQSYEGTAIVISAKAGKVAGVTVKDCRFSCNGIGYYCAEGQGSIDGVTIENCAFTVTPKTKIWGIDFPSGVVTHALSMPYALVVKGVKKLLLERVTVRWAGEEFSDSLPPELRQRIVDKIGEETLLAIEPKELQAVCVLNSEVVYNGCDIENYRRKEK